MSRNRHPSSPNPPPAPGARIKSWRAVLGPLPLLTLAACVAGDEAGRCEMDEVATLDVLTARGHPVVRAALNGTPVAFIVDTGAASSTVNAMVADRLGLPVDENHRATLAGIGGSMFVYAATIRRLGLGGAEARNVEFWKADEPHGTVAGLPVAGLFGADFLSNYDVLFDLPDRRIRLYRGKRCDGVILPPLADPLLALPFRLDAGNHALIEVRVDDHPFEAVLDSGAGWTILSLDDAHAAGITDAMLATDRQVTSVGIDGNRLRDRVHEFRSLAIGGETREPSRLAVGDIEGSSLIGDDFFRRNQVWISYGHRTAWFHPVGTVVVIPPDPASAAGGRPAR